MHRDPIGIDTEFQSLVGRYYDPATDQFLSVDPDVAETGQPYAFTGDNPVNRKDPLGLYITGGGSSECNRSSDGTLYCTGSTSNGQSVTGSLNTSTGVTTGAFTPASELTDSLADQKSAVQQTKEQEVVNSDVKAQNYFCETSANHATYPFYGPGSSLCAKATDDLACDRATDVSGLGIALVVIGMVALAGLGAIEALPELLTPFAAGETESWSAFFLAVASPPRCKSETGVGSFQAL